MHEHKVAAVSFVLHEEATPSRSKRVTYGHECSCGATRKLTVIEGKRIPDPWDEPTRKMPIFSRL